MPETIETMKRPAASILIAGGVLLMMLCGGEIVSGEWDASWKWGLATGSAALVGGLVVAFR